MLHKILNHNMIKGVIQIGKVIFKLNFGISPFVIPAS